MAKKNEMMAKKNEMMAKKNEMMAKNEMMEGGKRKGKGKTMKRDKTAKRKTAKRKLSKGASDWHKLVMKTFHKMRATDKTVKLRDAMKEAARLKKKGEL